jgi:hypothetical protein
MTLVFNIFVCQQIFCLFTARFINDEKNIFKGMMTNFMFWAIILFIAIGQAIIVEFGNRAFQCCEAGLHYSQWIISIGLGLITWIINFLIKLVPD